MLPQLQAPLATLVLVRKPFGLLTPSPEMKAALSARRKRSAMRSASHASTSKAVSSKSRCDAFGLAESSCSWIAMRSMTGAEVSLTAEVSSSQPAPISSWSTSTS